MEDCGLEVVDIENLRRHYALTLDVWAERFERNWETHPRARPGALRRALPPDLARVSDRAAPRCSAATTGQTHLFQIVFSKGNIGRSSYPMTREHLYGRSG